MFLRDSERAFAFQADAFCCQRELAGQCRLVGIEQEDQAAVADDVGGAVHFARRGPVGQVLADLEILDVLAAPIEPLADFGLVLVGNACLRRQIVELVRRGRQRAEEDVIEMLAGP